MQLYLEYNVRNGLHISDTFTFKTFPNSSDFKPRFAIYGDMGFQNAVAFDKIKQDVDKDLYDIILHIGDFAYDMVEFLGAKGDRFMRMIEPVAARVPYNVAVGNHEKHNNFSEYIGRFSSPPPSVFYHSFNVGPVHVVLFSTEFYAYAKQYGTGQLQVRSCKT